MSKKAQRLAARYGKQLNIIEIAEKIIQKQYHVSAFNNPDFPIITTDPEIQVYKWGLIPFWIKNEEAANEIRTRTYNARAESIFEKPSFRGSINTKRCIVPSTGFFDWRHEGKKKIPYFIQVNDEDIFSMAGIYSDWTDPQTGEIIKTFSIITTEANDLMKYIHNTNSRMPVILLQEEEKNWLDPRLTKQEIESFLHPFPNTLMKAYEINNDFILKNPHDPSIIEPKKSA